MQEHLRHSNVNLSSGELPNPLGIPLKMAPSIFRIPNLRSMPLTHPKKNLDWPRNYFRDHLDPVFRAA